MDKSNVPTPHIQACLKDIAPYVIMPGDPLRAKTMAERFLVKPKLVSQVRNNLIYTGTYQRVPITIASSGMGQPSIAIYAYELFTFYNVRVIIRAGSCGSYQAQIKVGNVVIVRSAFSCVNEFAQTYLGTGDYLLAADPKLNHYLREASRLLAINPHVINCHSSNLFYLPPRKHNFQPLVEQYQVGCVEMESYALFAVARYCHRQAACVLMCSDSLVTGVKMTASQRQTDIATLAELALTALVTYHTSHQ